MRLKLLNWQKKFVNMTYISELTLNKQNRCDFNISLTILESFKNMETIQYGQSVQFRLLDLLYGGACGVKNIALPFFSCSALHSVRVFTVMRCFHIAL